MDVCLIRLPELSDLFRGSLSSHLPLFYSQSMASPTFLRYASKTFSLLDICANQKGPNERRTISREDVGHYHGVIIGGVYQVGDDFIWNTKDSYFTALKHCVDTQPWLRVLVGDAHTDKAFYERAVAIDLADHVVVTEAAGDGAVAIERLLADRLDRAFPKGIPPWRIIVLPLGPSEVFVAFDCSHTLGDGPTGQAFHRTFLEGLCLTHVATASGVTIPEFTLPEPFDTPARLPISWSFLLAPILAAYIPAFISRLLGFKMQVSTTDEGTWAGAPMFFDPAVRSKIHLREIESSVLKKALQATRSHDAKLTATFQQLIVRALAKELSDTRSTNFVTQTAINMRPAAGIPKFEMGEYVSGCYNLYPRDEISSSFDWASASARTTSLASSAATLQDQAISLLRYLPSIRKWTLGKVGGRRDCSIEISNIGSFDLETKDAAKARMTKMVFAQPGHVTGPPISFNLASVRGGELVYTVTWQPGAMGIEGDEDALVERVCDSVDAGFAALV